jgi:hypothetical protein
MSVKLGLTLREEHRQGVGEQDAEEAIWTKREKVTGGQRKLHMRNFIISTSHLTTASRTALGPTQPPIQWVPGALSLGLRRPGREADHSPPSSADGYLEWSYTSTPQYASMAWYSVKAQE